MQLGKQSHYEWYGLRFRASTIVWAAEGVFKRTLLCVQYGPKRAAGQDDLKLGWKNWVSSAEDQGQTGIHEDNSDLPLSPHFQPQQCGRHVGRSWHLLCQTTHVLGWGHRAGRRRGARAEASEAQLRPLTLWGTSRSAPTGGATVGSPAVALWV